MIRNQDDGFVSKRLKQGDYFGESDILKVVGYNFFGEIVADSDDLECWFIPLKDMPRIPLFEQLQLKYEAQAR